MEKLRNIKVIRSQKTRDLIQGNDENLTKKKKLWGDAGTDTGPK